MAKFWNFFFFQVGWFACVLGAAYQQVFWTLLMASMGRTLARRVTTAKVKGDQETRLTGPLTPTESEDVTRMKRISVNAKSSKRLGTLMVRPLQKIGLSLC